MKDPIDVAVVSQEYLLSSDVQKKKIRWESFPPEIYHHLIYYHQSFFLCWIPEIRMNWREVRVIKGFSETTNKKQIVRENLNVED